MFYDAKTGKVGTIDGRETAPAGMPHDAFIDPATGKPYNFTPELVTSGVSVGVPGTLATWAARPGPVGHAAPRRCPQAGHQRGRPAASWSTRRSASRPSTTRPGSRRSPRPASLFLPGGDAPAVGSVFRTPTSPTPTGCSPRRAPGASTAARSRPRSRRRCRAPPKTADTTLPVPAGHLTTADLAALPRPGPGAHARGLPRPATSTAWRRPRSGGTTVGEALNILEPLRPVRRCPTPGALHHYLEASALAFADRGKYVGDPAFVDVPHRRCSRPDVRQGARLPDRPAARGGEARRAGERVRVRRRVPGRRRRRPPTSRTPRTSRRPT